MPQRWAMAQSSTVDMGAADVHGAQGEAARGNPLSLDGLGILDTIDVPTVVVGRDGKVTRFNRAATAALGLTLSDVGRLPRNILALTEVKDLEKLCAQVIADGAPFRGEIRDGDRWFLLRMAPY